MKRFLVLSVVSLLLLVSVAKCEDDEQPETDVGVDEPVSVDLAGVEGNSTTSRPKRQDIYTSGGWNGMMGGGDPGMMGGGGGGMTAGAPMAAAAVIGGGPGGGMLGGIPGGPSIGGMLGGGMGGMSWGGSYGGWDWCQPPWGCPRCSQTNYWSPWYCQNFCFSRRWCFCQW